MKRCVKVTLVGLGTALALGVVSGAALAAIRPERIQIVMSDFAFEPRQLTFQSGATYELLLVNRGTAEHELLIGRGTRSTGEGEEEGYPENFFEGIDVAVEFEGGIVETGELDELEVLPGHEVLLTLTVPAGKEGEWEMACFVPGHYELGMHGTVTVR